MLGLLNAVHRNSRVTQRTVATELGIALGLTNAYLKRCIKKGWIKANQAPARRYAYYLTPRGFAEKSRLTADYLFSSLHFFRKARAQIETLLANCAANGFRSLLLCGAGDVAEIARLCARDHGLTIVGLVDPLYPHEEFGGVPVYTDIAQASGFDAVLVTGRSDTPDIITAATRGISTERIFVPEILGISVEDVVGVAA